MLTKTEALFELAKLRSRKDFWTFCLYMDFDYFEPERHLYKPVCDALNKALYSNKRMYRLAISTPPRFGKSYIGELFTAWHMGIDKTKLIIRASYSSTLSEKLHYATKQLIQSDKYISVFGVLPLSKDNANEMGFIGEARSTLYTTSVGGSVTGTGASTIIADDLYKDHNEAFSDAVNERTKSWVSSALMSRFEGEKRLLIIIGTRWRVGEAVDMLMNEMPFDEVIKVKALTDDMKSFSERVISTDELLAKFKHEHKLIFNSMYQQEPMISSDSVINASDLIFVDEVKPQLRIALIDNKTTGKDNFAIPMIAIENGIPILEDVIYTNQVLTDELETRILNYIKAYKPIYLFIETNKDYSLYRNLKRRLKDSGVETKVVSFSTHQNKQIKIINNSGHIKRIKYMRTDDSEYNSFIESMYRYDLNKKDQKDDAIDSMAMIIDKLREKKTKLGVREWLEWI